jgi:hypothetical protein
LEFLYVIVLIEFFKNQMFNKFLLIILNGKIIKKSENSLISVVLEIGLKNNQDKI